VDGVSTGVVPVGVKPKLTKAPGSMQVQLAPVSSRPRTETGWGGCWPAVVSA
jgi:hypothetical protein